jgi:hypothetical protein
MEKPASIAAGSGAAVATDILGIITVFRHTFTIVL